VPPAEETHATQGEGILAGKVVDKFYGTPVEAEIQVVCATEAADKTVPLAVMTRGQGYFIIEGLKRGQSYTLKAQSRQDGRLLGGTTVTTASNIHVLIKISEDLVTKDLPAPMGAPVYPGPKAAPPPPPNAKLKQPAWEPGGDTPPASVGGSGSQPSIGKPQPIIVPDGPPAPDIKYINGISDTGLAAKGDPRVTIPGASDKNKREAPPSPQPPAWQPKAPVVNPVADLPTRVPSCLIVGDRVMNFALFEVGGQPWELKKRRLGKVVLLDFWHTGCPPCVAAITHLRILQETYGRHGLEIVGIACEQSGTPQEKYQRVAQLCQLKNTNYRLLMADRHDAVCEQFHVNAYPTLVLLDESGRIVWQHPGGLDAHGWQTLERRIKGMLGVE
jgi:thiol-disulfide isomerase/thioredoxin